MAKSKGAQAKGTALAAGSGGTVNVVLAATTAKDLLNALVQAVGGGSKKLGAKASVKASPKSKAASKAAPKSASKSAAKAAPKSASKAARK